MPSPTRPTRFATSSTATPRERSWSPSEWLPAGGAGQLVVVLVPDDQGRNIEPSRDRVERGVVESSPLCVQRLPYAGGWREQLGRERSGYPLVMAAGGRQYERVLLRAGQDSAQCPRRAKSGAAIALDEATPALRDRRDPLDAGRVSARSGLSHPWGDV